VILNIEINALITLCVFKMHDLIGWGIEDGSNQAGHSLLWIKLKPGMTKDLIQYLPSHEHSECKRLDWIQNGSQRKYPRLNSSFPRDKGKGSPECWVPRLMVHVVHPPEKALTMHDTVCPVKVSAM